MNLKADTCVCGSDHWHEIREPYIYCTKCGSIRRVVLESQWTIPLDRTAEMRDAVAHEERERKDGLAKGKSGERSKGRPPSGEWPGGGKPPSGGKS